MQDEDSNELRIKVDCASMGIPDYVRDLAVQKLESRTPWLNLSKEFKPYPMMSSKEMRSTTTQVKVCRELLANPLCVAYMLCISSFPDDGKATLLAAEFFNRVRAIKDDNGFKLRPLWHTIRGGRNADALQDEADTRRCPLLVLSGVHGKSFFMKHERMQDILVRYAKIPRIIVTTHALPNEFISNLGIKPHVGFCIGTPPKDMPKPRPFKEDRKRKGNNY